MPLNKSVIGFLVRDTLLLAISQGDAWNDPGIGTAPVGACLDVFGGVVLISLLS